MEVPRFTHFEGSKDRRSQRALSCFSWKDHNVERCRCLLPFLVRVPKAKQRNEHSSVTKGTRHSLKLMRQQVPPTGMERPGGRDLVGEMARGRFGET